MPEGRVKWFNDVKGFSFIEQDGDKNLFVHNFPIKKGVKLFAAGDRVRFDVVPSDNGLIAGNVRKL